MLKLRVIQFSIKSLMKQQKSGSEMRKHRKDMNSIYELKLSIEIDFKFPRKSREVVIY